MTASPVEKLIAVSAVVVALLFAGSAIAQSNPPATTPQANPAATGTTTGSAPGSVPQAPVGHRQPRAADVPAATDKSPADAHVEKLQDEGNKKLNICRGC
ncbi:MAG: hypothetical protein R3D69_12690 [Xanthobacteraceae bacterium]